MKRIIRAGIVVGIAAGTLAVAVGAATAPSIRYHTAPVAMKYHDTPSVLADAALPNMKYHD